jgi:chromosomal replication initiation ATPase DnaA
MSAIVMSLRGDWAKPPLLWALRRYSGLSPREIGEAVGGMDYTAASMAIKRFEQKSNNQEYLQESIKIVMEKREK